MPIIVHYYYYSTLLLLLLLRNISRIEYPLTGCIHYTQLSRDARLSTQDVDDDDDDDVVVVVVDDDDVDVLTMITMISIR